MVGQPRDASGAPAVPPARLTARGRRARPAAGASPAARTSAFAVSRPFEESDAAGHRPARVVVPSGGPPMLTHPHADTVPAPTGGQPAPSPSQTTAREERAEAMAATVDAAFERL